ncbi:MAG: trypsin-like peptidase domain-containing protein [Verrucomicrobiaceae bacterium]|nr:trypsin-like peptidase domain-containing protein [Verrucomicrobiaceae bacterium]
MRLFVILLFIASCQGLFAQAPGVPVYDEVGDGVDDPKLLAAFQGLRKAGGLPSLEELRGQMTRTKCVLELPVASTTELPKRELWKRARAAHLRVGWAYLCTKCDEWHLDLAGGYAVAKNAVATCGHVVQEPRNMKVGSLVAAGDDGNVFAVTEVLAMNRALDSALLKVGVETLTPLPLSTDVVPGDAVYCFSDPMGRQGFFSEGIVNRFVRRPFLRKKEAAEVVAASGVQPVFVQVNNDWAPGSSGSALIDAFGNAIGHVSEIESVLEDPRKRRPAKGDAKANRPEPARGTLIIFHDAIGAANVLSLVEGAVR